MSVANTIVHGTAPMPTVTGSREVTRLTSCRASPGTLCEHRREGVAHRMDENDELRKQGGPLRSNGGPAGPERSEHVTVRELGVPEKKVPAFLL
jgi:hypothetical protein